MYSADNLHTITRATLAAETAAAAEFALVGTEESSDVADARYWRAVAVHDAYLHAFLAF